jgi:cytochrome c oxidase cbb3-type subunit I/II
MYWAGWTQSLMWKEFTPDGTLKYQFLETVVHLKPFYLLRSIGGTIYFVGAILMVVNLVKTIKIGKYIGDENAEAAPLEKEFKSEHNEHWHRVIERRPVQLLVFSLIVVLIGGIVEFVPTFLIKSNVPSIASVKPYTPLELQGRDIYVREGCYTCHSQMVRPFRSETARYGEYSKAGEHVYDHPFQWGSKRTGPDLAREGTQKLKKSNAWHFNHFYDPTSISPGSIMPKYPWLFENDIDMDITEAKIKAMQTLGVPYEAGYEKVANDDLMKQANEIVEDLKKDNIKAMPQKEVIALIAYLQRLGTDISAEKK